MKRVSRGSKSEHEAVILKTKSGELILRRRGGNPLRDKVLLGLVGRRVKCEGVRSGDTLIVTEWTEKE